MKTAQLVWLIAVAGLAIVALGVSVILVTTGDRQTAGRVVAIAATAVGALVAAGPKLLNIRNGNGKK